MILNISAIHLFFIIAFEIKPFALNFAGENLYSVIFLHLMKNVEIFLSCSE